MPAADEHPGRGVVPAIAWSVFLACSWTWAIAMFFPVLLVRDFGVAGWVIFAVPNVLGAAAMGFVLSPEASRRISSRHRTACAWFSNTTIALHLFVMIWFIDELFAASGLLVVMATALVAAGPRDGSDRLTLLSALVVAGVSLLAFALSLQFLGAFQTSTAPLRLSRTDLACFAIAGTVGFLLCPYLDVTFHRARQATDLGTGRAAFAAGFGGLFPMMLVFSLVYAGLLWSMVQGGGLEMLMKRWRAVIATHVCLQVGFTLAVHLRERPLRAVRGWGSGLAIALFIAAMVLGELARSNPSRTDPIEFFEARSLGEVIFRCFLIAYGVVFPGYVWLCMIPTRRSGGPHAKLAVYWIAVVACLPMAYAGFVAGRSGWMMGVLATLGIARVVVELLPASGDGSLESRSINHLKSDW